MKLEVAKQFYPIPFGRTDADGPYNGQKFRRLLTDAFLQARAAKEPLHVVLDEVRNLGESFVDGAFGRFAAEMRRDHGEVVDKKTLIFEGKHPAYEFYIWRFWQSIDEPLASDDARAA